MALRKKQKKTFFRIILIVFVLAVLTTAAYLYVQQQAYIKAKKTHYDAFGIAIPDKYEIHGIDVSRYQETIAWKEVKAMQVGKIQLGFAFIKATEGIKSVDPRFKRNWENAKTQGVIRGAYHFYSPTRDGLEQAENFIRQVKLEKGDLPPVLDIELLGNMAPEKLRIQLKRWLDRVEDFYGVKPIIYTSVDFYQRYLGKEFDEYPLWAAHYYEEERPRINRQWHFWQHSDQGNVSGIVSKVDFNVFYGDSTDFRKLLLN